MAGDIVKDEEGTLWYCVQSSAWGDEKLFKEQPYSYFVTFDFISVGGNEFVYLPDSKELAALKDLDPDLGEDVPMYTNLFCDTYSTYSPTRIYLEEKNWKFGMANKTPFAE